MTSVLESWTASGDDIHLVFTDKILRLYAYGECCSQNWFEDYESGLDEFIGAEYDGYEYELDYEYDPETKLDECDEKYLAIIRFNTGEFKFTFRHCCNGYYSGGIGTQVTNRPLQGL